MKNALYKTRKDNLMRLILDKFQGNKAAFSRATEIHPNHVNLLCSDNPAIARNLGEMLARRIEESLGVPPNWMDVAHGEALKTFTIKAHVIDQQLSRALVTCRAYESITVTDKWMAMVAQNVTALENLIIGTVVNQEMEPKLPVGSTVVIDTGFRSASADGVYILSKGGAGFLRSIRKQSDGSYNITVANDEYKASTKEVLKGMTVHGKVMCVIGELLV